MLITKNFMCNVHETCSRINRLHLQNSLFQLDSVNGNATIAIFRGDSYVDCVRIWEKLGLPVLTTKEWFEGGKDNG